MFANRSKTQPQKRPLVWKTPSSFPQTCPNQFVRTLLRLAPISRGQPKNTTLKRDHPQSSAVENQGFLVENQGHLGKSALFAQLPLVIFEAYWKRQDSPGARSPGKPLDPFSRGRQFSPGFPPHEGAWVPAYRQPSRIVPYPRGKKRVFLTLHCSTMTTIYPSLKSNEGIRCITTAYSEGDFNTSNTELDKIRKSSILFLRDGIDSLSFWRSKWQTRNQQRRQFAVLTANGCGIAMSRERCAAPSNRCGMRLLRVMLSRRRRSCRARRGNWIRPPRKRSFIRTKLHGSSPG